MSAALRHAPALLPLLILAGCEPAFHAGPMIFCLGVVALLLLVVVARSA